jgi:hypothetical protein
MAKIIQLNDDNKIPVLLLGISIFVAVVMVVWFYNDPDYKPLVMGSGLYAFLGVISLGFWTNGAMQDYFFGIEKSYKTFLWMILGLFIGVGILSLSYLGLSMGVPLLPQNIGTNFRAILVLWFAPCIEDLLCFSFFGFILFLTRRCNKSSCDIDKRYLWLAIILTSFFFMGLHAVSYAAHFYEASTLLEGFAGLSAVSASLIAAFIFRGITCWFISLNGVRNIIIGISAHYAINQILFAKLTVIGLSVIGL